MTTLLGAGKLPADLLSQLITHLPTSDPHLLLGPSVGEDAAVIDFEPNSEWLLVAKSDPITFATDAIGHYAVNVCANDLAVTGARPRYYLPTILLPATNSDVTLAADIFRQIGAACRALDIVVVGGHTEVTQAVVQPVVAGSLLGMVRRGQFVRSGGCQPGDILLLAGQAALEGTSIIAREKRQELLQQGWPEEELQRAADLLYHPGISVLRPALAAAEAQLVTALHDPTEGGIATALLELAAAAHVGLTVDLNAIPIPDLTHRLCAAFQLDPLGTISSGALLATAAPDQVDTLQSCWQALGWQSAIIGKILPQSAGINAYRRDERLPFPHFAVDEITKLW